MKKNITIFYGGVDDERTVSQQSYLTVVNNIDTDQYNIDSIEIMTDGSWTQNNETVEPEQALLFTDYAWIAGHGEYMEDGQLQKILEDHRVPFNGCDSLTSQICFSKSATKDLFKSKNIPTPVWQTHNIAETSSEQLADELFQNFPQPCVIKPDRGGSSFGVSIARTKQEISDAIERAREFTDTIIVEEYISGTPATVGIIENFRDHEYYVLPPLEIVLGSKHLFDAETKHEAREYSICPASFNAETKSKIEQIALHIHRELELQDYSRSDFIIHPERGVYALEVNTLPGTTSNSSLIQELEAIGSNTQEFIESVIED